MAMGLNRPGANLDYRPVAEINVTPLVDVMLVLLVIFMVAAPLMVAGVPLDLPKTSATRISQTRKPMIVSLGRDGVVYLRDDAVTGQSLAERLRDVRAAEGDNVVYVRADKAASYGQVMDILGQLGAAGYNRVSLLSQPPAGEVRKQR